MNIPDRLKEFYSRLTGSRKAMTAAAAVGIAGMLMILFFGGNENEEPKENIVTETCGKRLDRLLLGHRTAA